MAQPEPGTDSVVQIESMTAPSTVEGLVSRGHAVNVLEPSEEGWGPVSAIDVGREAKGSADPRITTSAALMTRGVT